MKPDLIQTVRTHTPLIHCITNYVTVNDVANILLACGASPIMADDAQEVEEITALCDGLVLNIGTLNSRTIDSMLLAGKRANALGHTVVLDPVGVGASRLRTETAKKLLQQVQFSVIRGNISEISTLCGIDSHTQGVDAAPADAVTEETLEKAIAFAKQFSAQTGAVIAITGAIDIVADSETAYIIRNGHAIMSKVTGTGCMLTAVVAAYCQANPEVLTQAAAAAVAAMGLCGELAYERMQRTPLAGTSSFRTFLIDAISRIDDETLREGIKIEVR